MNADKTKSDPAYLRSSAAKSVVLSPEVRPFGLRFITFATFFFGREPALFIAADSTMGVQSFQDELRGRGANGVRLIGRETQRLGLLHQTLDPAELLHHTGRVDVLVEFQGAAEIEPLNDVRHVRALEMAVIDLADRGANQFPGHGVAALQLALVFQLQLAGDGGEGRVEIQDS